MRRPRPTKYRFVSEARVARGRDRHATVRDAFGAKIQGRGISVQPKSIAAAFVAASLTVGSAVQGAPLFQSHDTPPPANGADEGWKFPSLWKTRSADPQLMYQAPAPEPTAGQKLKGAFTNNALTRAFKKDDNSAPTPKPEYNPLSLQHPVTPPTPDLLVSAAEMAEMQGQVDQARQMYQQAIAAHPREVKCYRKAGHFEDRQGQMTQAETHYRRAALIAPNDPAVMNDLALCLARQGRLDESAQQLSRAIQMNPQEARYRNNMATVLMEMGDHQGALQQLMAAHSPAVAHYNMGHLLEKGGEPQIAAGYYAEATRLDPSLTAAREAYARVAPAPPAVASNTHSVVVRSERGQVPSQQQVPQGMGTHYQAPQNVVPPVVAPLPVVNQYEQASSQPWPPQTEAPTTSGVHQPQEPTFGPRLLPPVR
jgi:Tfp pilus assembly protein PilF